MREGAAFLVGQRQNWMQIDHSHFTLKTAKASFESINNIFQKEN